MMRKPFLFIAATFMSPVMVNSDPSRSSDPPVSPRHKIDANAFYDQYNGHPVSHLRTLAANIPKPTIWLTGDSTLDNKYWIPPYPHSHSSPHHAAHLSHPLSKRDISYWVNHLYPTFTTLNCAVEATTLSQRLPRLLPHDTVVADNIKSQDVLVVSIGGNDVGLSPSISTILSVAANVFIGGSIGMNHLTRLFRDDVKRYLELLTARTKPKLVLVCMLYYPDENDTRSWAGFVLGLLGYNRFPGRLQATFRRVYDNAVTKIHLDGVNVIHVPFFEVLDGKHSELYVERVEPSEQGGRVMATQIVEYIHAALHGQNQDISKS